MRIPTIFQKAAALVLLCSVFWTIPACGRSEKHQSPQEEALGYYWYEAVFPDRAEIEGIFRTVSDRYPEYEFVPDYFHVTTQYKPEMKHEDLYGSPVTVHIIGYANGSVRDELENVTSDNEGLLVEISSPVKGMQDLIDSCDKIWHITGSYSFAAKYTGQLDFSRLTPLDITVEGVFGMADSDGTVIFGRED